MLEALAALVIKGGIVYFFQLMKLSDLNSWVSFTDYLN